MSVFSDKAYKIYFFCIVFSAVLLIIDFNYNFSSGISFLEKPATVAYSLGLVSMGLLWFAMMYEAYKIEKHQKSWVFLLFVFSWLGTIIYYIFRFNKQQKIIKT